jgi:hypothetical protein
MPPLWEQRHALSMQWDQTPAGLTRSGPSAVVEVRKGQGSAYAFFSRPIAPMLT